MKKIKDLLSKFVDLFLYITTPLQDLMSLLGNPEPEMKKEDVDRVLALAQEGDILLSYEKFRLTNLTIKGKKDHAAIISSKMNIVEAVKPKVREIDLEEWLYKKDKVILLRPPFELLIRKIAAAQSLSYLNIEYDRNFKSKNDKVYCSELIYLCYTIDNKHYFNKINNDFILPIEFIKYCEVIFEN